MKRIAITGTGVIAPGGDTSATFFAGLLAGRSAIERLTDTRFQRLVSPIAAQVRFDGSALFSPARLRMLDRVSQLALAASNQAVTDAGLDFARHERSRCGVYVGTGMGGAQSTDDAYRSLYAHQADRLKPFTVLMAMNNSPAAWIGIEHGLTGPSLTFSTACSSSAVAIGEAGRRIASGDSDILLAGGSEAPLNIGNLMAWQALQTLAACDPQAPERSCKPFAADRSGMVLGEGAAFVVLEEWQHALARGAVIRAELLGYGLATDAAHITRPSVEGQAAAMQCALAAAALPPTAIGYLNAHGTGTLANDPVETAAIKRVFGKHAWRIPVSATKSMHGHLLGAAGALEFIVALCALEQGLIPPTANLARPDPQCDLDYVPCIARERADLQAVMSSSFAFGGVNAVLIAGRANPHA